MLCAQWRGKTGLPGVKENAGMSTVTNTKLQAATRRPFHVSPSIIARYFFHDCERFLRYQSTPREQRKTVGIPTPAYDTSRIMHAIIQSGHTWEEEALKTLGKRVRIAEGEGAVSDRRFTLSQTWELLRTVEPGHFIYQPTLRPRPASMHVSGSIQN